MVARRAWSTGAVAITGANGHVGRRLRSRLAGFPNQLRLLARDDDWEAGIAGAETVIHLAGTLQPRRPNTYRAANTDSVRRVVSAVDESCDRIVLLSYVGADSASSNPYLAAKGQAEELVLGSRIASVVCRSTFVYGDPDDIGPSYASYLTRPGGTVTVIGDGNQRQAPIHVDDLVDMIVRAALDPQSPTGIFEVGGPDVLTLDEVVRRLNPPGIRIRHLPAGAARLLSRFVPGLSPALVEVLLTDSVPSDPQATAAQFGIPFRHLPTAWEHTP